MYRLISSYDNKWCFDCDFGDIDFRENGRGASSNKAICERANTTMAPVLSLF